MFYQCSTYPSQSHIRRKTFVNTFGFHPVALSKQRVRKKRMEDLLPVVYDHPFTEEEKARWAVMEQKQIEEQNEVDLTSYKQWASRICEGVRVEHCEENPPAPLRNKNREFVSPEDLNRLTDQEHNIIVEKFPEMWKEGERVCVRWRSDWTDAERIIKGKHVPAPFCFEMKGRIMSGPTRGIAERILESSSIYIQDDVSGSKIFIPAYRVISVLLI